MIVAQPINANQCQCLKASFLGRPDPPGDAGVRSVGPYVENLAMLQSLRGDASASDLPKNQAPWRPQGMTSKLPEVQSGINY